MKNILIGISVVVVLSLGWLYIKNSNGISESDITTTESQGIEEPENIVVQNNKANNTNTQNEEKTIDSINIYARVLQDNVNSPFGINSIKVELLNPSGLAPLVISTKTVVYSDNVMVIERMAGSNVDRDLNLTDWIQRLKNRYDAIKIYGEYPNSGVFTVIGYYIDEDTIQAEKIIQTVQ